MGTLRFVFALSVLLGHIQINYPILPIYAVQGFYIISGFYMSYILNEKYKLPTNNFLFYKKRLFRLLPTYWLIAFISLIIAFLYFIKGQSNIFFFDFNNFPPNTSLLTYLFIIITNIIVWGQDLALFMGISPETGYLFFSELSFAEEYPMLRYMAIPVAWSVSSEFTFYFIAPYILRNRKKIVFCLFVISVISNFITNYYGLNNSNWRFRFFPSILMYFLAGYYAYILYKIIELHKLSTKYKYACLLFLISALTIFLNLQISYALHSMFLICLCTITIPYLFYSYKNSISDRTIGELSYPLYLFHPAIIGVNELIDINNKLLIVLGSIISAYLCYKLFIIRIEKIRNNMN